MTSLSNKTYWLIGASDGIGYSLAKKMDELGASLVISSRNREGLEQLGNSLKNNARIVTCDVTDLDSVSTAFSSIGNIDGLVYMAGYYAPMYTHDWNHDEVLKIADTNFMGALRVLGVCLPDFIKRNEGHIVIVGSLAGFTGFQDVVESSYLRHKSIKELIQQRFDSGMSAGRELSRAQAREAEALAKLTSVKQNLGIAISRFRIYFPDGELPEKLPSYPFNLNNRTLEESRNSMFKKNPNILQANEQYLASSYKTKNARASSLPRLDLEVTKTHYNVTKESEEFDTFAGVNLTYDIFTGGRDEAYKKQTKAEEIASLNNRDALIQNLLADLKESLRNLNLLPERLQAYKNAYTANKQSQFYAQKEFETSSALLLDLLQTERDFLDASESLIENMRSSEVEIYSYLQLTGELGEVFEVILN